MFSVKILSKEINFWWPWAHIKIIFINGHGNWYASETLLQHVFSWIPKFLFLNDSKLLSLLLLLPWISPRGKTYPGTLKGATDHGNRSVSWVLALFLSFEVDWILQLIWKYFCRLFYVLIISQDTHFILRWFSYKL